MSGARTAHRLTMAFLRCTPSRFTPVEIDGDPALRVDNGLARIVLRFVSDERAGVPDPVAANTSVFAVSWFGQAHGILEQLGFCLSVLE